ncbi:MAG: hypothetical protein FIA94_10885 [Nitrospirae bacterium]|nr:hypothetical protein [Nitrospirota bacterium]
MSGKDQIQDWVSQSKKDNSGLFSELDMLLRALDRYFNLENLPASAEDIAARNFYEELVIARDTILRVLGILEAVIPENRKNAYWFQKFAETKYLSSQKIDAFREDLYRQDTPEKGLHLLYNSFINMKGLITDISRSGHISCTGFLNVGDLVSKEIRENAFFNPFRMNMNPEFDVITNATISNIVRTLKDRDEKKHVSVIYLYLFRFVRIMSFIEISTQRSVSLSSSLMLLVLLRSEIGSFHRYIDKVSRSLANQELQMLLSAIAYQFSMETRRVYHQELKDIQRKRASVHFRGKIENSHGILKNLTEQTIVQLAQYYNPALQGEEVFASFMTRVEQSLRLREDIHGLLAFASRFCDSHDDQEERLKSFESLRNYMLYFESFTFRLLRHDDYEEFSVFFHDLNKVNKDIAAGKGFPKVRERVRHFKIFLETTLRHIGNRAELADKPLDQARIENLIDQYL